MEAKFTPGPWKAARNLHGTGGMLFDGENRHLADINQVRAGITIAEMDSNARLMAAAPDLYAACKKLAAIFDNDRLEQTDFIVEVSAIRDEIDAALAKADG